MTNLTGAELIAQKLGLVAAIKGGRCWNGAHHDAGIIVHAVTPLPDNCFGFWGDKSICGSEPGRRGYGWNESNKPINCPKCIKKLQAQNNNNGKEDKYKSSTRREF